LRQRRPLQRRRALHGRRHDVRQYELALVDVWLDVAAAGPCGGRRSVEGDVARAHPQRRFLVQAMGDAPAARRLREQRARPFRGRAGPGVRDVWMAGRLQEPGRAGRRRLECARQAGAGPARAMGPQISFRRLSGTAHSLAAIYRHALVGQMAEGQGPSPRHRLARASCVAFGVAGPKQISLPRREGQMGRRGQTPGVRG
jgi:hypothetical protein